MLLGSTTDSALIAATSNTPPSVISLYFIPQFTPLLEVETAIS